MRKRILFLCTGNSARSQIAEGLMRARGGSTVEVLSAGTAPKGLHQLSVQVMKEIGIDISHHESKDVDRFSAQTFDWVITVCDRAKEQCPIFPGARMEHWSIKDPEELQSFREVREDISTRVNSFLSRIGVLSAE